MAPMRRLVRCGLSLDPSYPPDGENLMPVISTMLPYPLASISETPKNRYADRY